MYRYCLWPEHSRESTRLAGFVKGVKTVKSGGSDLRPINLAASAHIKGDFL